MRAFTRAVSPRLAECQLTHLDRVGIDVAKAAAQQSNSVKLEFGLILDDRVGELATDAAMVRQIIDNFLTNAADALGETGGKIEISTLRAGDRILIEVGDNGCGIPADVLPRVFDPFFSTKAPGKNYGLGLAIGAALAESLGGALAVESKEGEGSRFKLWLPRRALEK